ncbi:MAG: GntR family transcriptional regulator [Alicyclobacillus sp.]|nr:GntR family transcriptional regulator [Alicyclobacillus sp.]
MPRGFHPSIPFYYQIREDLLRRIEEGEYPVGSQIPSEVALAERYGVSRPTIRQAIAELVQEGILVRGRGKGTFVAQPVITDNAQVFTTFAEPAEGQMPQWTELISAKELPALAHVARDLQVAEQESVYEVVIVRATTGQRLALRVTHIPARLAPGLLHLDLAGGSLFTLLQERYGLVPAGAVQTFQSVSAGKPEASALGVAAGHPLTLWQGVLYTPQKIPMARVRTWFRGDRFRFVITQGKAVPADATVHPEAPNVAEPQNW